MKAVILVGGEGTRLRPLTCNRPKPMISVVNKPFLEHVFEYLRKHSIFDIILSMGYKSEVIENYFGDGRRFGVNVTYVVESSPLGTAGGVKNVEAYLDGTCFVFNGDVMTDLDLGAMLKAHKAKGAVVTIALTPVEDPTAYGLVETDSTGRVLGFIEKPSWDKVTTNLINAGTYILEKEVLGYVPSDSYYMFERGLFPTLLQNGDLMCGYSSNAYWIDIGTPDKYMTVQRDLLMGRLSTAMPGVSTKEGIWVGRNCTISPTAEITPPVVLGNRVTLDKGVVISGPVVIGDDCYIGPESVVDGAVIWDGTRVGSHVVIKTCVVAKDCVVHDNVSVKNGAIIADGCSIGSGNKLEHGIKIWPGTVIEPNAITF